MRKVAVKHRRAHYGEYEDEAYNVEECVHLTSVSQWYFCWLSWINAQVYFLIFLRPRFLFLWIFLCGMIKPYMSVGLYGTRRRRRSLLGYSCRFLSKPFLSWMVRMPLCSCSRLAGIGDFVNPNEPWLISWLLATVIVIKPRSYQWQDAVTIPLANCGYRVIFTIIIQVTFELQ